MIVLPARTWPLLVGALLWSALGCARTSVIGVGGSEASTDAQPGAAAATNKAKTPTRVEPSGNELLGYNNPILGDVDGDGFDDFLVAGYQSFTGSQGPTVVLYLFYGRPEFPARLSTADADASFDATDGETLTLGDVNGDGLADFGLRASSREIEFVMGQRSRRAGRYATHASGGAVWHSPDLPPPFAADFSGFMSLLAAGDANCDGFDDVLLTALHEPDPDEGLAAAGLTASTFLILGGPGFPAADWDRESASARFTGYIDPLAVAPAGDLDGDGCGDILSTYNNWIYLFYGGPHALEGKLDFQRADASLRSRTSNVFMPLGDLDGDGAGELFVASDDQADSEIVYGKAQRLSGIEELAADLRIELDAPAYAPVSAATGDMDGDLLPELVIGWGGTLISDQTGVHVTPGAVHAIRGTGARLSGSYSLGPEDELEIAAIADPITQSFGDGIVGASLGPTFSVAGDVDGDGGSDIIAGLPAAGSSGAVYILPSTPRAPD